MPRFRLTPTALEQSHNPPVADSCAGGREAATVADRWPQDLYPGAHPEAGGRSPEPTAGVRIPGPTAGGRTPGLTAGTPSPPNAGARTPAPQAGTAYTGLER